MKKIFLVLSVLAAGLSAFAATNLSAQCTQNSIAAGYCFETSGYRVEVANPFGVVIPSGGTFPVIVNGQSVFTYKITRTGGKSLNHLDVLIPPCMVAPGSPGSPTCNPLCTGNPIATLYGPGLGDPNTGFGIGLTNYQAYVFNYSGPSGTISFKVSGKVFALPNAMLLNRGTGNYAYGQILSPSCSATCDAFSPSVPLTTNKVVTFGGLYTCLESPDSSGCPTSIYSCCTGGYGDYTSPDGTVFHNICLAYSNDPCTCDGGIKEPYTDVAFAVGEGSDHHLLQVWTESDPQCPITATLTGSVCCQVSYTVLNRSYTKTVCGLSSCQ